MELEVLRESHFRALRAQAKSSDTLRFYKQAYRELETHLGPENPKLQDVEQLTRDDFYAMLEGMRERGCVPGTLHAIMRGLRASFNWAYEEEYIEQNPFARVKMPSVPRKIQPCVQPEMAQRVLRVAEEDGAYRTRNTAILMVMFDTGLRLSEVAKLELPDVNLKDGVLKVWAGKGGHDRYVPFGNSVVRAISKYQRDRRPKFPGETRLWIGRGGEPLTKWGISLLFDGYAERLGVDRSEIAPHAWRRGFAVQYLRNGGEMFALQQLLGHTSLEMTRKYVNYLPVDLKRSHMLLSPLDRILRSR
ncbi:tyrosine-type recombinase/integrase [Deinococcus taklimakanensis]|uniref:Tyrosine-type recombinase/integrase n=1 Tax=Deinococcus taklimakanensis TaxID=536443 RepID=A0ABW5NYS4_9DEIO